MDAYCHLVVKLGIGAEKKYRNLLERERVVMNISNRDNRDRDKGRHVICAVKVMVKDIPFHW